MPGTILIKGVFYFNIAEKWARLGGEVRGGAAYRFAPGVKDAGRRGAEDGQEIQDHASIMLLYNNKAQRGKSKHKNVQKVIFF